MEQEQEIGSASRRADVESGRPYAASLDRAGVEHVVKTLISERRRRITFFPGELFADPAWDILLVLTLAEARYHRLSVSKVCDRVDVPTTTTLRWINILMEAGLLVRRDDVNDKRRKFIELTPHAYVTMAAYCSTTALQLPLAA